MNDTKWINVYGTNEAIEVELTDAEQAERDAEVAAYTQQRAERELKEAAAKTKEVELETKAAATLATEATIATAVKDKDIQAVIKSLLTRIEYLEKIIGIDHSAKQVKGQ